MKALVRYGINRKDPKTKRRVGENHEMVLEGAYTSDAGYRIILDEIIKRHPGWGITGWFVVPGNPVEDTPGQSVPLVVPGYVIERGVIAKVIEEDNGKFYLAGTRYEIVEAKKLKEGGAG